MSHGFLLLAFTNSEAVRGRVRSVNKVGKWHDAFNSSRCHWRKQPFFLWCSSSSSNLRPILFLALLHFAFRNCVGASTSTIRIRLWSPSRLWTHKGEHWESNSKTMRKASPAFTVQEKNRSHLRSPALAYLSSRRASSSSSSSSLPSQVLDARSNFFNSQHFLVPITTISSESRCLYSSRFRSVVFQSSRSLNCMGFTMVEWWCFKYDAKSTCTQSLEIHHKQLMLSKFKWWWSLKPTLMSCWRRLAFPETACSTSWQSGAGIAPIFCRSTWEPCFKLSLFKISRFSCLSPTAMVSL